jgi:serine/threonine-protein kinase RsbW
MRRGLTYASATMIEVEFDILSPHVHLQVPAVEDSIPVARQALRSLGETIAAEREALEDAELALTEACANAVEHAYGEEGGKVVVTMAPHEDEMHVSVRDFGRGIPPAVAADAEPRGFGLAMIEGLARHVQIRREGGTEVSMAFPMGLADATTVDGSVPGVEPAERVLRRLVAVVAAQSDMASERLMEALLVAELVARYGLRHLIGERVRIRLERTGEGFDLQIGPLEPGGADAVVTESEVPGIGSIVDRLADGVRMETEDLDGVEVEFLVLHMDPSANAVE